MIPVSNNEFLFFLQTLLSCYAHIYSLADYFKYKFVNIGKFINFVKICSYILIYQTLFLRHEIFFCIFSIFLYIFLFIYTKDQIYGLTNARQLLYQWDFYFMRHSITKLHNMTLNFQKIWWGGSFILSNSFLRQKNVVTHCNLMTYNSIVQGLDNNTSFYVFQIIWEIII